ncbi:MAG: hypothetical protein WA790_17320 [Sulfitobacter sp.]
MKIRSNTKRIRRTGRGSVALIAMLLVTSAVLRLASGAGVATAGATADSGNTEAHSSKLGVVKDEQRTPENLAEMSRLLVALQEREARVSKRETEIKMHSKALAVADEEIAKRLIALENAEIQLRSTLALADGAAEDDLARLTSVYESMKPKDASALFEMMEPDFAAGFLARMRPDAAAALMAGLTPDAAYSISVILASRNANVPKS